MIGTLMHKPEFDYKTIVNDSGDNQYVNRILVGTPSTGLVRIEWHQARNGQTVPVNWSWVQFYQYINSYVPLRYQVADAQNLIVKAALDNEFQWCLLYEHDVIPQPDALIRLNEYMRTESHPVVSGLYYTRSFPSEPLVFRGRGLGAFYDWKMGDIVYCDGVPTGFLLIHVGLLKVMWDDSEEYELYGQKVRRVFRTPRDYWIDPESANFNTVSGTSDLEWCTRVINDDYLRKAGWNDYVDGLEDEKMPFIVDTNLFCKHINMDGTQFPQFPPERSEQS